ncbi:MAG: hypothetical protein DU429_02995 [Candidatus Tokpelaia sp.]|nr:MAG: hypothetical protein DU429_02995 [Candidatus Tokpelaia sp.]KAA6405684.1 hypothetical protein DPQ22_03220 [Candidatus Tokpelaia sp.]
MAGQKKINGANRPVWRKRPAKGLIKSVSRRAKYRLKAGRRALSRYKLCPWSCMITRLSSPAAMQEGVAIIRALPAIHQPIKSAAGKCFPQRLFCFSAFITPQA